MTGSGKTHTIAGTSSQPGIVPRTVHLVFSNLRKYSENDKDKDKVSMVFLTYVELYNNFLYDLLEDPSSEGGVGGGGSGLKIHDQPNVGVQLTGSSTIRTPVSSAEDCLMLIAKGNKVRATSATNLNERSSRSHTVISLEIITSTLGKTDDKGDIDDMTKIGKINLVDLAGSERVKMSGAQGQVLEEAKQINKALTVLGDVLNTLSKFYMEEKGRSALEKPPHVPYRNSKLTMLLKDSLGGNAKTMMIATIRRSSLFYQQSLTSLRYAARTRHIKCSPVLNIGTDDHDSNSMQKALSEVTRLRQQLDDRTKEFNYLSNRLKELESGNSGKKDKESEQLQADYKKQIEELQKKNSKEKQQLSEHLGKIIHHHEGQLADKEKEYVTLSIKMENHLREMEILSRDKDSAILSAQKAELSLSELQKQLKEKEEALVKIQSENSKLKRYLAEAKDRIAEAALSAGDKVQFVDALQKVTASRTKHKKAADELVVERDKLLHQIKSMEQEVILALATTYYYNYHHTYNNNYDYYYFFFYY
jgi:hypothetical protein